LNAFDENAILEPMLRLATFGLVKTRRRRKRRRKYKRVASVE